MRSLKYIRMKLSISKTILLIIALGISEFTHAQDYKQTIKFGQFLNYLENRYVDSINGSDVVEQCITYYLSKLDPHSIYISADDVRKMNEPLQGNFEGIGIQFNILNDTLFVVSPVPGGPSEKVGLRAGDRIVKVDGKNIAGIGLTNEMVFSLLRGEKGTKVSVSVYRKHVKGLLDFTITRDKIPINSIDASYVVHGNIGYIKLSRFALNSTKEFMKAAEDLKQKGVENIILDLTGNAGGYLDVATSLADQFLSDGRLIVYTKGLHSPRHDYLATSKGIFEKGHVIILIDEGSASASEILSGAIQDWDRGIIIGRRSFGKGLVQQQLGLPDGSMIRLTVARYYTPTGRLIQKPYNQGLKKYEEDIYDRYRHGEFENKDSIHFPDSLKYKTLLHCRTVFGGGGIMPDIFVPLDTSGYSDYYSGLIRKGILNQFVLEYVDKNRKKLLNTYPSFEKFKDKEAVTKEILDQMTAYAAKEGLPLNQEQFDLSKKDIKLTLKAYIARDLWTTNEFYEIINENDKNFLKAVEVMDNWDKYQKILTK